MRLLLFGGTSEGRRLAEALEKTPVEVTVSVATQYGRALLSPGVRVLEGKLTAREMSCLMKNSRFDLVVDAVHPYASEASENIRTAAKQAGLPLLSLHRESAPLPEGVLTFPSAEEAAPFLSTTTGNILLTTGVNSLPLFAGRDYTERLYVRVLPALESIQACLRLGIPQSHIFAMQGPFSAELNIALMRHWAIETLVTKESGDAGGFLEKADAAASLGARLIVITRTSQEFGLTLDEALERINQLLEETP